MERDLKFCTMERDLKFYTMERDLYKEIKLVKTLIKQIRI